MAAPNEGLESRRSRLLENKSGAWGSTSQDFVRLANLLFESSRKYAPRVDGNCSIYALAGIPMLFSALRCLLVELNDGMYGSSLTRGNLLPELAMSPNDVRVILDHYAIPTELRGRLQLLIEVRHEIVHPSPRPSGEGHNTPTYLQGLRDVGLLQSTGQQSDYMWIAQLQSHKLFKWAFEIVRDTVEILLHEHGVMHLAADGVRASYSVFETIDVYPGT